MFARHSIVLIACLCGFDAATVHAQPHGLLASAAGRPELLVPQRPLAGSGAVRLDRVDVAVVIDGALATTTMDLHLRNPSGRPANARMLVPVPRRSVVRAFDFRGQAAEPTARVLAAAEARRTYDALVRRVIDPGLLEFVGLDLVRTSVFPVPAHGTQQVRLVFENLLGAVGGRVDYELPRSSSRHAEEPEWRIRVRVRGDKPVAALYSPTHEVRIEQRRSRSALAVVDGLAARATGPFRLSVLREGGGDATVLAYPDPAGDGGTFLLLGGLPDVAAPALLSRELTLVLDRSGSMRGSRLEQLRVAARRVLDGLRPTDRFNLIAFNHTVDAFADSPVPATANNVAIAARYLDALEASGGTNLHDALALSLRPEPAGGYLPLTLLISDGRPTVGPTSERRIRALTERARGRRIFAVGVGADINSPLLEALAVRTGGAPTFVPDDDRLAGLLERLEKRLEGPRMADLHLEVVDESGRDARRRLSDVVPVRLPDLFEGDALVVLGRYHGAEPLRLRVGGREANGSRQLSARLDPAGAVVRHAFVPRLWASRQIAILSDEIRERGADGAVDPSDPRVAELVVEIVRLSREHGVLTEYTAFFAAEGTDLGRLDAVLRETTRNYARRAVAVRSGLGSVSQSMNLSQQRTQRVLNNDNRFVDERMVVRSTDEGVRQIADRTFFRRGGRWVDSELLASDAAPTRVLTYGSVALNDLATELAPSGRQSTLSLPGETLAVVDGRPVLIRNPIQ